MKDSEINMKRLRFKKLEFKYIEEYSEYHNFSSTYEELGVPVCSSMRYPAPEPGLQRELVDLFREAWFPSYITRTGNERRKF